MLVACVLNHRACLVWPQRGAPSGREEKEEDRGILSGRYVVKTSYAMGSVIITVTGQAPRN